MIHYTEQISHNFFCFFSFFLLRRYIHFWKISCMLMLYVLYFFPIQYYAFFFGSSIGLNIYFHFVLLFGWRIYFLHVYIKIYPSRMFQFKRATKQNISFNEIQASKIQMLIMTLKKLLCKA